MRDERGLTYRRNYCLEKSVSLHKSLEPNPSKIDSSAEGL